MSDNGIDYGQLLPWLQDATAKDQTTALNTQAKGVNNVQDLTSLFFDPKFAALFGSYDPTLIAQQAAPERLQYQDELPLTQMYLQGGSSDPTMQMVVSGIVSGQLTPVSAKRLLMEAASTQGGELAGMDPVALSDSLDAVLTEITNNETNRAKFNQEQDKIQQDYASKPKDDIYSRAGLPSPLETYGVDNAPIPEAEYNKQVGLGNKAQMSQAALQDYLNKQMTETNKPQLSEGYGASAAKDNRGSTQIKEKVGSTVDDLTQKAVNAVMGGSKGAVGPNISPNAGKGPKGMLPGYGKKGPSTGVGGVGKPLKGAATLDRTLQTLQNNAQIDTRRASDEAGFNRGYAEILQKAGKTPLSDALERRKQLAAMLGLV